MSKEKPQADYTVRLLPPEEYIRLELIFAHNEGLMPDPSTARSVVAEDSDGNIIGCFGVYLVANSYVWVSDDFRHRGIVQAMVDLLNTQGVTYIAVTEDDRTASICASNGMREIKGARVFVKE